MGTVTLLYVLVTVSYVSVQIQCTQKKERTNPGIVPGMRLCNHNRPRERPWSGHKFRSQGMHLRKLRVKFSNR